LRMILIMLGVLSRPGPSLLGSIFVLSVVAFYLAPVIVQDWLVIKKMDPATAIYVVRIMSIAGLLALRGLFTKASSLVCSGWNLPISLRCRSDDSEIGHNTYYPERCPALSRCILARIVLLFGDFRIFMLSAKSSTLGPSSEILAKS